MDLDLDNDIAVIGLACRVPAAPDAEIMWGNLCAGRDSVTRVYDPASGRLARAGGCVEDLEWFDASFFGVAPREAQLLDPQHRMFLECAWSALEQAGYAGRTADLRVGVFGGTGFSTYLLNNVWPSIGGHARAIVDSAEDMRVLLGADKDFLTGRTAYLLNLTGPSVTVQAACASGLYAVHLASQALLAGECEIALAGAASATVPQLGTPGGEEGTYVSCDGFTRTFDRDASGSVFGSGAGLVVLKVLADALRDGDVVRAVVKGTAVNNDGADKTGLTAPSVGAQQAVIEQAMAVAKARPCDVGMIEAHGTATPIGDPIEVAALNRALSGAAPGSVVLTSIKPNIGHLGWAAGIIGFCKGVLCVEHGLVPPTAHFSSPNPQLDLDGGPLRVTRRVESWNAERAQVAGVSAFGVGGFNAHAVLHAPPSLVPASRDRNVDGSRVIVVSATSRYSLAATACRWADVLEQAEPARPAVADLAYTSIVRRKALPLRHAVVGVDHMAMARELRRAGDGARSTAPAGPPTTIAALFTGYTPDLSGCAAPLAGAPAFQAVLDAARDPMIQHAGQASVDLLLSEPGRIPADTGLVQRHVVQFVLQSALLELWRSCGVEPAIVTGHSLGEYAAAYASGVFDLSTGIALVALRTRLYLSVSKDTGMAVLGCGEARAAEICATLGNESIAIAAVNSPGNTVVAGTIPAIEQACAVLRAQGARSTVLPYSRAGHSRWVDPTLAELGAAVAAMPLGVPSLEFISGATGRPAGAELATPKYWRDQIRQPVRFADAVTAAMQLGADTFVEIGAAPVLSSFVPAILPDYAGPVVGALSPGERPWHTVLSALAELYTAGLDITWPDAASDGGRSVVAPTYAFERQRFWIDGPAAEPASHASGELAAFTLRPTWMPDPDDSPRLPSLPGRHYLLLADRGHLAAELAKALAADGAICTVAAEQPAVPLSGVIVAKALDLTGPDDGEWDGLEQGLFEVSEALRECGASAVPLPVWLITRGAQLVGDHAPCLAQAPVWAIARSAVIENPELEIFCVDLDPAADPVDDCDAVIDALGRPQEAEWAYRSGRRFLHRLAPSDGMTAGSAEETSAGPLDPQATYLITGGIGALGLLTAGDLIEQGARRLVLVARNEPAADAREAVERLARRAHIDVRRGDVARPAEAEALVASIRAGGSWIGGVVHAAGVIDDATLESMTLDQMRSTFAGKARGAWNMHRAVGNDPRVRFFTSYSSVASVTGNAGQANYAAANAFVDALASYRVAKGLPGLALAWGAWADVGLLARRPDLVAKLAQRGLNALPQEIGLRAIRDFVPRASGVLAITAQDWVTWSAPLPPNRAAYYSELIAPPALREVGRGSGSFGEGRETETPKLTVMSGEQRQAVITEALLDILAKVLGIGDIAAEDEHALSDLGLDSLSAITLRARIRQRLGLTLAMATLANGATVATVVDALLAMEGNSRG